MIGEQGRQTFAEALDEFVRRTGQMLGQESREDIPPPPPAPLVQTGPPFESALRLDEEVIRQYALSIGEDNPLYTDPAAARSSCHETMLAPGPVVVLARYPVDHGAVRPGGYPVANYVAGIAFEFLDALRPGIQFRTSKVPREFFEKPGRAGRLLFLVSETVYWDQLDRMAGKAYGSLIFVPMETMGSTRIVDRARLGEGMIYDGSAPRYDAAQFAEIWGLICAEERRGSDPRWWEDVEVGDELVPIAQPPYTIEDSLTYQYLRHARTAAADGTRLLRAFRPAYRRARDQPDFAREHPVTRWPYTPGEWDEHYDVFLAPYRGAHLPFDFGVQRAQIPHRLLANWMGDAGFVRKLYMAFRRPVFYGDAIVFRGRVVRKYTITERGTLAGVAEEAAYAAVAVAIEGTNQLGERHSEGFAHLYLPSREHGPPKLPVPHPEELLFVPFDVHRSAAWY